MTKHSVIASITVLHLQLISKCEWWWINTWTLIPVWLINTSLIWQSWVQPMHLNRGTFQLWELTLSPPDFYNHTQVQKTSQCLCAFSHHWCTARQGFVTSEQLVSCFPNCNFWLSVAYEEKTSRCKHWGQVRWAGNWESTFRSSRWKTTTVAAS